MNDFGIQENTEIDAVVDASPRTRQDRSRLPKLQDVEPQTQYLMIQAFDRFFLANHHKSRTFGSEVRRTTQFLAAMNAINKLMSAGDVFTMLVRDEVESQEEAESRAKTIEEYEKLVMKNQNQAISSLQGTYYASMVLKRSIETYIPYSISSNDHVKMREGHESHDDFIAELLGSRNGVDQKKRILDIALQLFPNPNIVGAGERLTITTVQRILEYFLQKSSASLLEHYGVEKADFEEISQRLISKITEESQNQSDRNAQTFIDKLRFALTKLMLLSLGDKRAETDNVEETNELPIYKYAKSQINLIYELIYFIPKQREELDYSQWVTQRKKIRDLVVANKFFMTILGLFDNSQIQQIKFLIHKMVLLGSIDKWETEIISLNVDKQRIGSRRDNMSQAFSNLMNIDNLLLYSELPLQIDTNALIQTFTTPLILQTEKLEVVQRLARLLEVKINLENGAIEAPQEITNFYYLCIKAILEDKELKLPYEERLALASVFLRHAVYAIDTELDREATTTSRNPTEEDSYWDRINNREINHDRLTRYLISDLIQKRDISRTDRSLIIASILKMVKRGDGRKYTLGGSEIALNKLRDLLQDVFGETRRDNYFAPDDATDIINVSNLILYRANNEDGSRTFLESILEKHGIDVVQVLSDINDPKKVVQILEEQGISITQDFNLLAKIVDGFVESYPGEAPFLRNNIGNAFIILLILKYALDDNGRLKNKILYTHLFPLQYLAITTKFLQSIRDKSVDNLLVHSGIKPNNESRASVTRLQRILIENVAFAEPYREKN